MRILKVLFVLFLPVILVACSDDDSGFVSRPDEKESSSSVTPQSSEKKSSSSAKSSSSSSIRSSSSNKSSSSEEKSSSSTKSSSSIESSSSEFERVPCNVESDTNCFVDLRDGQTYRTVKIGEQIWMAENLNYETNFSSCYGKNDSDCTKYGRLYQWSAAMDSAAIFTNNSEGCGNNAICIPIYPVRGVCPEGWHLPTRAEWRTLFMETGDTLTSSKKLKSTFGWEDYQGKDGNGSDSVGFMALPVGYMRYGDSYYRGIQAYFWTSETGGGEIGAEGAYVIFLNNEYENARVFHYANYLRCSVRCLKDDENLDTVKCDEKVDKNCLLDERDGQRYKTVEIGNQVWMAENLNYVTDSSTCYRKMNRFCRKYGRLYIWADAVGKSESECGEGEECSLPSGNIQGVCPNGWHLPSLAEWKELFEVVKYSDYIKSDSIWTRGYGNSDRFGFNALPAGYMIGRGGYDYFHSGTGFWSSTESRQGLAYGLKLVYNGTTNKLQEWTEDFGLSVRCVKD